MRGKKVVAIAGKNGETVYVPERLWKAILSKFKKGEFKNFKCAVMKDKVRITYKTETGKGMYELKSVQP